MPIRLLKLRAWLKTRTNTFLRAARAPVLTVVVAPKPEPHAFDAWVCDNIDPEDLFADLDRAATAQLSAYVEDPVTHYRVNGLL